MFDCLYKYRLSSVESLGKVVKVIVITIAIISVVEAVVSALVRVVIVVAIVVVIVTIGFFTTVVALNLHSSLWFKAIYSSIICSWEI